jgi:hypothetical protein
MEADGNFDHMAACFPPVMGDASSLWLNNLPAGSITSWADLSRDFMSNFQVTYNRPGNAFNLVRVIMKPGDRLRDYTNRFFENYNTCVGDRDDQVVDSYMKGLRDRKVFEKIHESDAMTVAPLMEVVNKLIDTEEAWSTSLTTTASKTLAPLVLPVIPAQSSVSHLQRCLRRTGGDPQRSTTRSSTQCSTAPARSTKGAPTQSASASSSRGCFACPRTPNDL